VVVLEENRVCLRNVAAQACGIELGATLATAHSIHPALKHMHRDSNGEQKRLNALADTLYRFSGYVSVQAPDCVLLEIGGSLQLFGCHQTLMDAALELCQTLGHYAVGRVGATPWAAIALARARQQQIADVPLSEAGLALAGVDSNVVERFANMGIYTLGPLLNLSGKALGRRFGKALLRYLAQLTGTMPDPRPATTPAPGFTHELHLLAAICDKADLHEHALSPMQKLSQELQQWLITRQLGCERLEWRFISHHKEAVCVPVHFAKGKQNAQDFIRVSQLKLEQVELPAEVLAVGLAAKRLQPWSGLSQSLFKSLNESSLNGSGAQGMSEIIDEFNARLGDGTCSGLQTVTQHTPEGAWHAVQTHKLVKTKAAKKTRGVKGAKSAKSPKGIAAVKEAGFLQQLSKRPLWLFDPPRQVRRTELELLHGPERVQSQWWQGAATRRDYYIAQHRLGAECWAFVDAQSQWYLHGYFG
jgi:protein ImuB